MSKHRPVVVLAALSLAALAIADDSPGHSRHGSAFDTGLRQKPWIMEGIGSAPFPITTTVPEVQQWFDQGNALLASFWYEEAERSFRWCLKLDPECAMAYWGLARCGINWSTGLSDTPDVKRYRDFLLEAVRRKGSVTPRERMYIEAWDETMRVDQPERSALLLRKLLEIAVAYPDDLEAASLLALASIESGNTLGTEMIVRDILRRDPDHPGAHHVRIHNWDGSFAQQALESCQAYGRIAPGIGHAMHMPGHNYSKIGMWHEAAFSMDAATRFELRYMNDRMALPFETWNYAHNRNYLCYIQEQLGMAEASLQGSGDLLAAPRQPGVGDAPTYNIADEGLFAQIRALVKFERWDTIQTPGTIQWPDRPDALIARSLVETLALIGQGRTVDARARFEELKALAAQADAGGPPIATEIAVAEGLLRAAEGDLLDAIRLLTSAAEIERSQRDANMYMNDPPFSPWPANRVLGDVCLRAGESQLAILAYERALEQEPNDAFSLAGLAQAHARIGNVELATQYAGRFKYVWSNCDPGLRWNQEVEALGLDAEPIAQTPAPERQYTLNAQDHIGPLDWEPFAAPRLECADSSGATVQLEDFVGKNVIVVFYLGEQCPHCVEQLVALGGRAADWTRENTVILAVSSTPPEDNLAPQSLGDLPMHLLSDQDHANARRFTSYDDFEEMELHSTILIDTLGRVHWKRTGGDPFMDMDFLLESIKRMNGQVGAESRT